MDERQETIDAVVRALTRNELVLEQLTARHLGALVGRTTGHLYHHFGSLDGLLFEVAQAGYKLLGGRLVAALENSGSMEDVAEAFVVFGLSQPTLYALMFDHRFDWAELRARGQLPSTLPGKLLFDSFQSFVAQRNVDDPAQRVRLIVSGLHGLVSLALTGRANIGAMERTDSDIARSSARKLMQLLFPCSTPNTNPRPKEPPHATRRSTPATPRADARQSAGQGGAHRTPGQRKRRAR